MDLEPPEPTIALLETDAIGVVGKDWYSRLDKVFTSSLGKYRKYKGNSVRDLLRAMRNKVSFHVGLYSEGGTILMVGRNIIIKILNRM